MSGILTKGFEFFKDNWAQILAILTSVTAILKVFSLFITMAKNSALKKYLKPVEEKQDELKTTISELYEKISTLMQNYKSENSDSVKSAVLNGLSELEEMKKKIFKDILSDKEIEELEIKETIIELEPITEPIVNVLEEVKQVIETVETLQKTNAETNEEGELL